MNPAYHDKTFDLNNYEEFYEHHTFQPIREQDCLVINEIIPRFGWAFDKIEELGVKSVLDLGCLDGSFALTVSRQLGIPTTGVDLTVDGVELARKRSEKYNLPAIFSQGTIEDWLRGCAYEGMKFDCVTWFEIIEHVKDPELCIKLIDAVLAPGGHVLVSTPAFESPHFGMDDEQNKCHIRLYTTKDDDYEAVNKYGHTRKATSITKQIGKDRIKEIGVYSELINVHYQ